MAKTIAERILSARQNDGIRITDLEQLIADATAERDRLLGSAQHHDRESIDFALSDDDRADAARLTVYVGSASSANGVTGALADGLALLADNLDVIIPAIATISALMGTSLVVNAIAGSRAFFALTAAMGGAATAAEAATFAFGGLTGVLSGPGGVVLAIAAVGAGLYYLVGQSDNASKSIDELRDANSQNAAELDGMIAKLKAAGVQTDELAAAADRAKGSVDGLADSYRQALIEARKFSQGTAGGKLQTLNDDIRASQNRQANLVEYIRAARAANPGAVREGRRSPQLRQAEEKLGAERRLEAGLRVRIQVIAAANDAGVDLDPSSTPKASTAPTKPVRSRTSGGPSGPTQAEKDARAADEEANLRIERLRAEERLTDDATARADLQRQILAEERAMRESDIEAKVKAKALTADQAAEQRKILDALYGQRITEDDTGDIIVEKQKSFYGQAIAREEQERLARQQTDAMRDELAALGAESGVTDVRKARVEIERRMLEIQQDIERKLLDEAIARGDVADAAAARAALARKQAADTAGFDRDSKGPLGQYLDDIRKVGLNMDDEFEKVAVNGLQSLNDGLTDAIMNSKNLGDVFKSVAKAIIADLIRIAIQQTIVNSLASAFNMSGGGGGGSEASAAAGIAKGVAGFFGRASGGYVAPGQTVRVNEQRGGAEYLRMGSQGGTVIPLGQINQRATQPAVQGGGVTTVRLALSGDIDARIDQRSASVAVEVVRATAGEVSDLGAQKALNQLSTPRL